MTPRQPVQSSDEDASDAGSTAAARDPQSDAKHAEAAKEDADPSKPTEEEDRLAMYLRGPTAFTA
ncbi:MAG TPA: hypothetical protein VEZ16_05285 [Microvirga sp.]|nr:hypothetical protein [Microvirga sp.]